jgi:Protein of unknown function (DUF2800)
MAEHAKLSASGAHRWLACPASVRMEDGLANTTSEFAEEGTLAHSIAEGALRAGAGATIATNVDHEMRIEVQKYVDYVIETPGALYIEQRVDFSKWVPEGFGTADAIKITEGTLTVIDLKYGKGIPVSAENNPQAMLYGLGAVDMYDFLYEFDTVKLVIHQPRLNNVSEWEISKEDLLLWGLSIVAPAARLALEETAPFNPGEKACQWCKAKNTCAARAEMALNVATEGFGTAGTDIAIIDRETLSNEQVAGILPHVAGLIKFCNDIKAYAKTEIEEGREIPGFKLVDGKSSRVWTDETVVASAMARAKLKEKERYNFKLLSPAQAEKKLGKDHHILKKYVEKKPGAPTLVPETDKRQSLTFNALEGFGEVA